jgi:hypothetical protein
MAWSPEDRRKFLGALDTTEGRLLDFYRYLLYFLIVSVTLLAAAFYHSIEKDAFRDFLRLYGSILYLIFLAWAIGQLFVIRKRQSRAASGSNAPSPPGSPRFVMNLAKEPATGARKFSFQFGSASAPKDDSAKTFNIGFSANSLADEDKLDEASLAQADAYVAAGAGLDFICRLLNPRYKDWSSPQQLVYRAYLQGQIELRKTSTSQGNETFSLASELQTQNILSEATSFSLPEGETSPEPRFTLVQIVTFFVLFTILAAATLAGLFFARAAKW